MKQIHARISSTIPSTRRPQRLLLSMSVDTGEPEDIISQDQVKRQGTAAPGPKKSMLSKTNVLQGLGSLSQNAPNSARKSNETSTKPQNAKEATSLKNYKKLLPS